MKITVTADDMKRKFEAYNRDYFTYDGLNALLDYYNEIDENKEFDPIEICCDCTEYGEGAACSYDDLIDDYGYKYPVEEWLKDNGLEESEYDKDLYIASLIDHLELETMVLHVPNCNYIVFEF